MLRNRSALVYSMGERGSHSAKGADSAVSHALAHVLPSGL